MDKESKEVLKKENHSIDNFSQILETSEYELETMILDKEMVLKNNSVEQTAEDIAQKLTPQVQLIMMSLSEEEIEMLSKDENQDCIGFVNNYCSEDIDDQIEEDYIWSSKHEYRAKWEEKFGHELEDDISEDLLQDIDNQYDYDKEELSEQDLTIAIHQKLENIVKKETEDIVSHKQTESKQEHQEINRSIRSK